MTRVGLDTLSAKPVGWAIALMLFGVVTIVVALVTSAGVAVLLAWLIQVMGALLFIHAVQSPGAGHTLWKVLVAILYLVFGFYLLVHPMPSVAALTLVLTAFFVAEGVTDVVAYLHGRKDGASAWILFDGIVTLILGLLMWRSSSLRVIATLVGISMIMTGTTRLMLGVALKDPAT